MPYFVFDLEVYHPNLWLEYDAFILLIHDYMLELVILGKDLASKRPWTNYHPRMVHYYMYVKFNQTVTAIASKSKASLSFNFQLLSILRRFSNQVVVLIYRQYLVTLGFPRLNLKN